MCLHRGRPAGSYPYGRRYRAQLFKPRKPRLSPGLRRGTRGLSRGQTGVKPGLQPSARCLSFSLVLCGVVYSRNYERTPQQAAVASLETSQGLWCSLRHARAHFYCRWIRCCHLVFLGAGYLYMPSVGGVFGEGTHIVFGRHSSSSYVPLFSLLSDEMCGTAAPRGEGVPNKNQVERHDKAMGTVRRRPVWTIERTLSLVLVLLRCTSNVLTGRPLKPRVYFVVGKENT